MTRETVDCDTPARFATSVMLTAPNERFCVISVLPFWFTENIMIQMKEKCNRDGIKKTKYFIFQNEI